MQKMNTPALKPEHKYIRMGKFRRHTSYGEEWNSVIFSDETKT